MELGTTGFDQLRSDWPEFQPSVGLDFKKRTRKDRPRLLSASFFLTQESFLLDHCYKQFSQPISIMAV
jgi:hypothetical protein